MSISLYNWHMNWGIDSHDLTLLCEASPSYFSNIPTIALAHHA